MSDCKIYPADTVDIYGNVWPTVGENIRNGMFGETVKVGYVNIDKGNFTSADFINITSNASNNFIIRKINCIFIFPISITQGGLNLSIANKDLLTTIRNTASFSEVVATVKIIYKDII